MGSIILDIRLALRGFALRPGFTAVFVLTTALGVGAATAVFSASNPILFDPLPYADGNRIVAINQVDNGQADRVGWTTIHDVRERSTSLERVALVGAWQATVAARGEPTQSQGLRVTPDYFALLGVRPALGRDFRPEDDTPNAPRTVILSHAVWRDRFNADRAVVNSVIRINDVPYTVIGVLPAGYEDVMEPLAQFWRPLQYDLTTSSACRSCQHLHAIGRLRAGTDARRANAEVAAIFAALGRQYPRDYPQDVSGAVSPLGETLTASVRPAMTAVFVAVLMILLIACANATNLLLGRAAQRQGEIALRGALGASRARVVQQLVVESFILSGAGGILGIALAWIVLGGIIGLAPAALPRVAAMHVNVLALLAALRVTIVIGVVFGLVPALHATRGPGRGALGAASRRVVRGSRGLRSALVATEMALAVLILCGSGLLLRSMIRLLDVRPGFDPKGILTLQLNVVGQRFNDNTVTWNYYDRVLAAVRAVPGVDAVAYTSQLPLSDDYDTWGVHSERHPALHSSDDPQVHRYGVAPTYLDVMRIPVVAGRTLTSADDGAAGDSVALVSAGFAARFFRGENAIGQRIRIGDAARGPWRTIVGVTGDIRQVSLAGGLSDAVYVPDRQMNYADSPITLVIRTQRDPTSIVAPVRAAIWSIDKSQPILRVMSMEAMMESSAGQRRFVLTLFEAFAALAAVLAALGMYGVLATAVSERVREIGVRTALGATPLAIVRMIVGEGTKMAAIGAGVGVAVSGYASSLLADQLFRTSRADLATYASVLGALVAIVLAASAVPAARAAQVDPLESLRAE